MKFKLAVIYSFGLAAMGTLAFAAPAPKGPYSPKPTVQTVQVVCKNTSGSGSQCRAWCADYDARTGTTGCAARNCTSCPKK